MYTVPLGRYCRGSTVPLKICSKRGSVGGVYWTPLTVKLPIG